MKHLARAAHPLDFSALWSRFKSTMLLLTARLGPINLKPMSVIWLRLKSTSINVRSGYDRYSASFSQTLSLRSVFETIIFFSEVLGDKATQKLQ